MKPIIFSLYRLKVSMMHKYPYDLYCLIDINRILKTIRIPIIYYSELE